MLSSADSYVQRLIAAKRCELQNEKRRLGIIKDGELEKSPGPPDWAPKAAWTDETPPPPTQNDTQASKASLDASEREEELQDTLSWELLKYMRRHSGLPPMLLKVGEFSPNNPLFRAGGEGAREAFPGLGAYGERRERLRARRRSEYRDYLERQVQKKNAQHKEERPTQPNLPTPTLELTTSPHGPAASRELTTSREVPASRRLVEAATQCERAPRPCVAVQTDGRAIEDISAHANGALTQAERELSPRTVQDPSIIKRSENSYLQKPSKEDIPGQISKEDSSKQRPYMDNDYPQKTSGEETSPQRPSKNEDYVEKSSKYQSIQKDLNQRPSPDERPIKPNLWTAEKSGSCLFLQSNETEGGKEREFGYRRRSYDHAHAERQSAAAAAEVSERPKLRDLRHTYLPSFLDAEVIRQRNDKAHQEAQERRRFYQQELRNQIQEQQRIREERKAREKLLEEAGMRRLEGQLRTLHAAQQDELDRSGRLGAALNEDGVEYNRQRNLLVQSIDNERVQAFRSYSQPLPKKTHSEMKTSKSDNSNLKKPPSKLPFYYQNTDLQPYSSNISESSLFSPNCDLESYLRHSLNPAKTQNAQVDKLGYNKNEYVPSFLHRDVNFDSKVDTEWGFKNGVSDAMKRVENKWQVPIVQKNTVRTLASSDGTNKNILTQLGSIRRQLQLEQMRLDQMLSHEPATQRL